MGPAGLALLLALVAGAAASQDAVAGPVTPLLAWASVPGLFAGDAGLALQAHTDLAAVLVDLVEGVARPGGGGGGGGPGLVDAAAIARAPPEVVLVLLGSQLRTSDLRRRRAGELQARLDKAQSSLALPFITQEGKPLSTGQLQEAILARLPGEGASLQTAGCGEGLALAELPQLLLHGAPAAAGSTRVVLGCSGAAVAGGLLGELSELAAAHDAVAALGKPMVTLVAVAPSGSGAAAGGEGGAAAAEQRRRLLAAAAGYTVCDERCRTQVKWLEGMLALLLIIIASLAGMCCLGVLDTPTRFETPKDQRTD